MPTVYGTISANGGLVNTSPQVHTAEKIDKGRYSVKFESGTFTGTPVVLATVLTNDQKCGETGTNRTISVTDATSSKICFGIRTASAGNESSDRPFSFVAFGD